MAQFNTKPEGLAKYIRPHLKQLIIFLPVVLVKLRDVSHLSL